MFAEMVCHMAFACGHPLRSSFVGFDSGLVAVRQSVSSRPCTISILRGEKSPLPPPYGGVAFGTSHGSKFSATLVGEIGDHVICRQIRSGTMPRLSTLEYIHSGDVEALSLLISVFRTQRQSHMPGWRVLR
jgi:hypothetical protein